LAVWIALRPNSAIGSLNSSTSPTLALALWGRACSTVSWSEESSTTSTTVLRSATVISPVSFENLTSTSAVAPCFLRTALARPASSVSISNARSTLFSRVI